MDDIESNSSAVCGGVLDTFIDPWWQEGGSGLCAALAEELAQINAVGSAAVLATVIKAENIDDVSVSDKCLIREGKVSSGNIKNAELLQAILKEAQNRLQLEQSRRIPLELEGTGRKAEVFFEVVTAISYDRSRRSGPLCQSRKVSEC